MPPLSLTLSLYFILLLSLLLPRAFFWTFFFLHVTFTLKKAHTSASLPLSKSHMTKHELIHESVAALSQGLTTGLWD